MGHVGEYVSRNKKIYRKMGKTDARKEEYILVFGTRYTNVNGARGSVVG
jgi:hypothetical protein